MNAACIELASVRALLASIKAQKLTRSLEIVILLIRVIRITEINADRGEADK